MGANNLSFSISIKNTASTALNSLKSQVTSLKSGIQSMGSGVSNASSNLTSLKSSATSAESKLSTLGSTVTRVIGIFGGFKIVSSIFNTITSSIDNALDRIDTMDMFRDKMTLITGDAANATQALEHLQESTKGTPYALDVAARGVQNFVLRGMDTQQAVDSIDIWMDAVSTYGKGTNEQFESVIDAIAKMRSKGTVEMRYLNRLFAVGINPVKMYADATGQAATDVQTALSNKDISTEEFLNVVEDAMRNGTNGVIKIAGNAKTFATTWAATIANMKIAITRGWADVIDTLDEAFKVIDPNKGLKGIVAKFGTTVEDGLKIISKVIKTILPPILKTAKDAFDYWKTYYFNPLKEYFDSFIQPVKDSMKTIQDAFKVEGEVDISSLTQALDYKGTGSLRDALLEVVMSWENLKKTTRDTWSGLNPAPEQNAQPQTYKFDLDSSILSFLNTLDNTIGKVQSRIPQLLTSFKNLSESIKNAFGGVIEIFLTLAGGIAQFTLELGSILVPPAIDILSKGFSFLADILNELSQVVKRFANQKLPQIIENINTSLTELSQTPFVQSLIKSFEILGDKVSSTFNTIKDYSAYLRNEKNFTFDPTNIDQGNVIRIFDNIRKLFDEIVKGVQPVKDALSDVFDTDIKEDRVTSGFSNVLESIADLSEVIAEDVPKIVNKISNFAAKVIRALRPVGEFIWKLATKYILPFAVSVIRAFVNVGAAIAPLVTGFGELVLAIAGFIIPPALTLFTNICNWIADHADIVVAGLISIVTGFLAFKAISTITSVLSSLSTILFDTVIPAVTTFFRVMTTEGIGAAIATLMNPAVLIPVIIVALVGLAAGLIYLYNTSDTAKEKIDGFIASFLSMTSGINVGAEDVSNAFKQLGDWINNLKEKIDGLLKKIDEFFDKFDGFRTILKAILKAPFMDFGGWLGSNEDVDTDTLFNPYKDLGTQKIAPKFEIPTPIWNESEFRDVAEQSMNAVNESIQQSIPEVQANGTMTVNALYNSLNEAIGANGAIDTSQMTANIDNFPTEGYEAGSGMGWNLANGINEASEGVYEATDNISGTALGTLNTTLAGDPTYQTGVSFINTFNAGFVAQAESSYMLMSTFINNCLTILQAGFNNPESVVPTTIAQTLSTLMLIISQKVEMYCAEINEKLTACYEQFKLTVETTFDEFVQKHDTTVNDIFPAFQNNIKAHLDDTYQKYVDFNDSVHRLLDDLNSYHYRIGVAMMDSLKRGIEDTMPQVETVEGTLVQRLKDVFEQGMGIHSPADKWIWYGQMLIAGLIQGMQGDKVQKFINNMIDEMNTSFKDGKFNADQTVNFLSEQGTLDLIGRVSGVDTSTLAEQMIAYPLAGGTFPLTSTFGNREAPTSGASTNHQAVDIGAPSGTPILAILDGTVTQAGWNGGYGNSVTIDHGNGLTSLYGHMSAVGTNAGATVRKGQNIGQVGSTGVSTGAHLHLGMFQNGTAIDPEPYLGGAAVLAGNSLASTLQAAYNRKYHPELLASSTGNVNYDSSAGAKQWAPQVLQALAMLGQPASLLNGILYAIDSESGGNPNARNDWDSNAAIGQNSAGLLQTIPDTFNAYRNPNLSSNIYDPLANIYAGLNYMLHRYGSIEKVISDRAGGWYGYAVGTRRVPFDMPAMIHKDEAIIPASQNPYTNSGGDYLADLFNNAIGNTGINDLDFDFNKINTGNSGGNNVNNNLNNVFNIHNDSDVNADRNVNNMEAMLHQMLQDGMRAGSSR